MCQLDKYIENENGYIAKCHHSEVIQILFGNILLSVTQNNFLKVLEIVKTSQEKYKDCDKPHLKHIVMSTQANGYYVAMNKLELNEFNYMLEEAKFLMDVESISFDNGSSKE